MTAWRSRLTAGWSGLRTLLRTFLILWAQGPLKNCLLRAKAGSSSTRRYVGSPRHGSGGVRLLSVQETIWERGKRYNERKKGSSEPLQVDCCGGQVSLDLHVVDAAADGARQAMPGLCLPVESFRAPPVAPVKPLVLGGPAIPASPSS